MASRSFVVIGVERSFHTPFAVAMRTSRLGSRSRFIHSRAQSGSTTRESRRVASASGIPFS